MSILQKLVIGLSLVSLLTLASYHMYGYERIYIPYGSTYVVNPPRPPTNDSIIFNNLTR